MDDDKRDAYDTLYTALVTLAKTVAPFLPFVAEEIYRGLTGEIERAPRANLAGAATLPATAGVWSPRWTACATRRAPRARCARR